MKKALLLTLALTTTGFAPASQADSNELAVCEQILKFPGNLQRRFGIYRCQDLCILMDFDDRGTPVPCDQVSKRPRYEFDQ